MKSILGLEGKADLGFLYKRRGDQAEELDQDMLESQTEEREVSQKILQTFIFDIASNLNGFCTNNLQELKKTMINKTSAHKQKGFVNKPTAHEIKN